ncbi:DNA-methyltransferase [Hugenholtzia roseola]|uniref:DNA-methyltransferase n=1 Tax=Hugenholtzia roseola TaxID=1002 RepID=UPI00041CBC46|nr:site-specific DNA-methyltransferase [Hugenholtzia roseola]
MTPKNKLFYGDNLEVLRKHVKDESVDLCYIDPPFNSKRNYNQIYNNIGKEDKAQAQAFVDTWTWNGIANEGFDEIVSNKNGVFTKQSINLILGLEKVLGRGSLLSYLVSMTQRIAEIYRVLKPTGSFYLHCDPTASHYLKLVLDAIFCSQGGDFRNEIVWHYRRWTNVQQQFQSMHDIILFYSKSNNSTFNFTEVDMSENQKKKVARGWDSNVISSDKEKYSQLIVYNKEKFESAVESGKLNPEKYKNIIFREKATVAASDVIILPSLNSQAKERLGYPTQKPEQLLEKIIQASSNEGDVILDCYCGCGTTIAVAERLNRQWVGIDITYQSISLIMKRLEDSFGKSVLEKITLSGIPEDMESAIALANKQDDRTRKEFEKWIVLTYSNNRAVINDKKGGDGGIDGTAFIIDYNEAQEQEFQQVLFSVKSNKSLSPTVIRDLYGTVEREKAVMGFFLTLYPMPNLVKEAEKYGNYQNKMLGQTYPKITVVSVQEILAGKRMHLPTSVEVLKKAVRKAQDNNNKGFFNE